MSIHARSTWPLPNVARSTRHSSVLTRRHRSLQASVRGPHGHFLMPNAKVLISHRNSESSYPVGAQWSKSSQCRVDRKMRHNVGGYHKVKTGVQLICGGSRKALLGHGPRARWKDAVSSGQTAASSLPLHVGTHPQNGHVRTSAALRILREEIASGSDS